MNRGGILAPLLMIILYASLIIIPVAAWITHVVVCIKTASWLLLIAGGFIFPIGIIHGAGAWFGAW